MTTPGWRTPRSTPTRRAPPAPGSSPEPRPTSPRHGITRIERVMTDNHFSYRLSNDVQDVLAALGAKHILIRPHCPWQNGKVERLNRTLQTEWAYRQIFTSNTARAAALAPWLEHYNTQRHHTAIDGTPLNRVSPT